MAQYKTISVIGDSIAQGYFDQGQTGWPSRLARESTARLDQLSTALTGIDLTIIYGDKDILCEASDVATLRQTIAPHAQEVLIKGGRHNMLPAYRETLTDIFQPRC